MMTFDDPRFKKPANQWTLEDLDAWSEIEAAMRDPKEVAREEAEAQAYAEQRQKELNDQYEGWKQELAELLADKEGDENTSYRIQCLRADIFGFEEARAAIERGDEEMAENLYEGYLQHPL
jgi:hypothetical protein